MSDGSDMPERATPTSTETTSPAGSAEGSGPMPAAGATPRDPSPSSDIGQPDIGQPDAEPATIAGHTDEDLPADAAPIGGPDAIVAPPAPARRRRWRRRILIGLGAFAAMITASVVLGTALFAASVAYTQYGAVKDGPNAEAWRSVTQKFAGAAACTTCHEPQATAQDASAHIDVSCEACHGAGAAHAASDTDAVAHQLLLPSSRTCVRCHATTPGRPADFPQVDPARHYSGGDCLRCHDPHSIVAVRPPLVTHPLADLPVCITCHAPDGLKKIPAGHELVPDATCLACHGPKASGGR